MRRILTDDAVAKVQHRRRRHPLQPGVAATMFETLGRARHQHAGDLASEIKVSVLIDEDEMELAVRVLHTAFGLDAPTGETA